MQYIVTWHNTQGTAVGPLRTKWLAKKIRAMAANRGWIVNAHGYKQDDRMAQWGVLDDPNAPCNWSK